MAITCSLSTSASSAVSSGAPASVPKLDLVLTVFNSGAPRKRFFREVSRF
jgi:hypothetical protein